MAEFRTLEVNALARVEGEGAYHITMHDGKVEKSILRIYEPPRFYEAFLQGRDFREVPDITARICGICPVAYQMSACHALDKAIGIADQIPAEIHRMRDLLYCGEWIQSHVLHMFMLHLPDFLGYESAISMAADHGDTVKKALQLKKVGNIIMETLGGRSVHPVGACVGGFYSLPEREAWEPLLPLLREGLETMCELTLFLAEAVDYPDFEMDYEFVALQPPGEYPMNRGPIGFSKGYPVDAEHFLDVVEEIHIPHSTALHARVKQRGVYHVGPLARLNLNADNLHPRAAELLPRVCLAVDRNLPWKNSFFSLPARALETVHALALALDILEDYEKPAASRIPAEPRPGVGAHATEAPRGLLWHRYKVGEDGLIKSATIMPPTSQNQAQMENDLRNLAEQFHEMDDVALGLRCEQLIRNYDPCISCSVHFLDFRRERI